MPYFSKPLIAILGLFMSLSLLSLAVVVVFPFFQTSFPILQNTVAFTATGTASKTGVAGDYLIVMSININRLVGSKTYMLDYRKISIYTPNGDLVPYANKSSDIYWDLEFLPPVGKSTGFTIKVHWTRQDPPDGYWIVVLSILDPDTNKEVQTLTIKLLV
jgi:hypothetical protein